MRERLKGTEPAREIQEYLFKPQLENDIKKYYNYLIDVNKAHVLMLLEQRIIRPEVGTKLIMCLQQMENEGPEALRASPVMEDLYFNFENRLMALAGREVGGQIHTGRSRNDIYATVTRMWCRTLLLDICYLVLELRRVILELAEEHVETVMTGYTHLQPAQPITFGYYLSGIGEALERDYDRLYQAFDRVNRSPLGAAALAATSFPIDREKTAAYLGFHGLVVNALDAVASRDFVPEIVSGLAILMTTLSRLAQDLYVWASHEFGFVEVSDNVAACSSIMPQKKNPITLEHIKAKAAHAYGALVSSLAALKTVPFSHSRDVSAESIRFLGDVSQEAMISLRLMQITLRNLKVRKERMEAVCLQNFCTVTDLADALVKECGIAFRDAHRLVGSVVMEVYERGGGTEDITVEKLQRKAEELLQRKVTLSEVALQRHLDPRHSISLRTVTGGPAPGQVKEILGSQWEKLKSDTTSLEECRKYISEALRRLNNLVKELIWEAG